MITKKPDPPSSLVKGLDKRLDEVILRCLNPDPKMRMQSAAEFRDKLMSIRATLGQDPAAIQTAKTKKPRRVKSGSGKGGRVALVLIILIALAGGGYWSYSQGYFDKLFSSSPEVATPIPPALTGPVSGQSFNSTDNAFLTWQTDKDRAATYELQIDRSSAFASPQLYAPPPTGRFHVPATLDSGTYFWRVRTRGSNGVAGEYSTPHSFTLNLPSGSEQEKQEEVAIPETPLIVSSNIPSAISIDGQIVSELTESFIDTVAPGSHTIAAENSDSRERRLEQTVDLTEGRSTNINFEFTPVTKATLAIASQPSGASVFIDDRIRPGVTTPTTLELEPGFYKVAVGLKGEMREKTVTLHDGDSENLSFDFFARMEQDFEKAG